LIKLYLEDFGPFERADLELRPLTIFIGRNSVGKSMLSYLLWALSSAEPKFEAVEDDDWRPAGEAAEKVAKGVARKRLSREDFECLVKAFCENVLMKAVRAGLEERFRYTFGAEPRELVRINRGKATIEFCGDRAKIKLSVVEKLNVEEFDLCLEDILKNVEAEVPRKGDLHVKYRVYSEKRRIASAADVINLIIGLLAHHLGVEFERFILSTPSITSMLPDSRAGITRTLLKPYLSPSLLVGVLGVDREYVSLYFRLAEWLRENPWVLENAKPLLDELGASLDVRFESGAYNIYVKTWSGRSAPIAMAPSGVREVLSVALALTMPDEPSNVFIEEPEAHLHPRAQRALARVIAWGVNVGKRLVVTTHSDYIVSALNNLMLLSRLPEERRKELGYAEGEALSPEGVAAYLVRAEGDRAVVERLQVTEDGIPEDEFGKVAEELLGERGRMYEAREGV
jgi:hypothetical protein